MRLKSKKLIGVFIFSLIACLLINLTITSKANSGGSYGWGMKPSKDGLGPEVGNLYESIISKHNAFYIDKTTSKRIYLTFDAGYENGYTTKILDILKKNNISATFFLTGHYLNKNPELVKRMVVDGHYVGNHTWSHPDLTKISKEKYAYELTRFEEKYKEITKKEMLKIMRPPSGRFSNKSLKIADELGYYNVFWSLAYRDWETNNQHGWEYAYNMVMERIHPGAIILMHSCSSDNLDALDKIIVDLRTKGYEFVPITRLIMTNALYVNFM